MPANPAKKIFNDPLKCADELLDGLVLAYDGKAKKVGQRSIVMNDLRPNAPALLVGGGAGHEPIYHGLAGKGMADGAATGDIFAASSCGRAIPTTRCARNFPWLARSVTCQTSPSPARRSRVRRAALR